MCVCVCKRVQGARGHLSHENTLQTKSKRIVTIPSADRLSLNAVRLIEFGGFCFSIKYTQYIYIATDVHTRV